MSGADFAPSGAFSQPLLPGNRGGDDGPAPARDRSRIKQIYIYPSVVCSNYVVYGFNADETVLLCCIGTLVNSYVKILPSPVILASS